MKQSTVFDGTEYADDSLLDAINDPNPMVHRHGYGPENETCKNCAYVLLHTTRSKKRFYKCELHGVSNGDATDHRLKWSACSKFREAKFQID